MAYDDIFIFQHFPNKNTRRKLLLDTNFAFLHILPNQMELWSLITVLKKPAFVFLLSCKLLSKHR